MMDSLWQQIVIVAVVGAAIVYLVYRSVTKRRQKCDCASCLPMKTKDSPGRPSGKHPSAN